MLLFQKIILQILTFLILNFFKIMVILIHLDYIHYFHMVIVLPLIQFLNLFNLLYVKIIHIISIQNLILMVYNYLSIQYLQQMNSFIFLHNNLNKMDNIITIFYVQNLFSNYYQSLLIIKFNIKIFIKIFFYQNKII